MIGFKFPRDQPATNVDVLIVAFVYVKPPDPNWFSTNRRLSVEDLADLIVDRVVGEA